MSKNLISELQTERRNEHSTELDQLSAKEIVLLMNKEDHTVAQAVNLVLDSVEKAVELAVDTIKNGGRLIYIGAGTSGRMGIMDAVECPPTFSTSPDVVQAVVAGGESAFKTAIEGAEDKEQQGAEDLRKIVLSPKDTVVGIAASGRTPYVLGGLLYAKEIGAKTVAISNNKNAVISSCAEVAIEAVTGPEVLTGSTRLKAATAQKMILNMISTASMIQLGKTYENLMIDLNVSNYKLKERAKQMISTITNLSLEESELLLEQANLKVKTALVMHFLGAAREEAEQKLAYSHGFVRHALNKER
ncbi:N-acetylmuramic acid 6-phosphate etherase [Jeotgalibacillus soli]|uniref:N-acetylmuramic acid 6-phosphate etherase n=1 Tax=Jeotgalibacillus soli TaxID=889306 RepID=UPI001F381C58|nr:N-acetylmuramic acid 6-phosphate etherase [Jeotgalibacillus soli]